MGWDAVYRMVLANERNNTRAWAGTFALVAMYDRALTPALIDGNFRADLVVPSNKACTISCASLLDANGVDVLFAGLRCFGNADCASGACDMGLCRCTATAQCCAAIPARRHQGAARRRTS